jgi:hypothetical protein
LNKGIKTTKKLSAKELAKEHLPMGYEFFKKNKNKIGSNELKKYLHRFSIRYRLAKSFKEMKYADDKLLGKTYLEAYDIGMKLFLTCTAYELIYEACKLLEMEEVEAQNNKVELKKEIVDELRKNNLLLDLILGFDKTKNSAIVKNIKALKAGYNDVLGLAIGIRNLFAHGIYTPVGAGITEENIDYYDIVDKAVLKYANELFYKCSKIVKDMK